jgi:glycosyltransferase involved in cell wall biosynthesis
MDQITVAVVFDPQPYFNRLLDAFADLPEVKKIIVISPAETAPLPSGCARLAGEAITSGDTLNRLFAVADTPYLLFLHGSGGIHLGPGCLSRFLEVAKTTQAGMVYSDYLEIIKGGQSEHPVNDYQPGSIRDDFDFGQLTLISVSIVRDALSRFGHLTSSAQAGFYDLRLKLSLQHPLFHLQEYLYAAMERDAAETGPTQFTYVDPCYYAVQKEMEGVATEHLRRIGAYLEPVFAEAPPSRDAFPVEASVVIPIRNRRHTIAEAVQSALFQGTDFPFNVIVVDNHSSDGTTALLSGLSQNHPGLRHIIPSRHDLSIGGCWNEAVFSADCGRFAVQLDSDDLYSGPHTLQKIVDLLRSGNYAMVIGSYTLVNARLEEIPPGMIDHREWTEENGRNNALRVNGLGAPRAFNTELLRKCGFLNVGYGEDYAVALRISREYQIGRIYENLYLCRRWEGNSDAALTVVQKNRHDAFKDNIRTLEIMARQEMNRQKDRGKMRQKSWFNEPTR